MLWHTTVGFKTLGWWKGFSGQEEKCLCELDPSRTRRKSRP